MREALTVCLVTGLMSIAACSDSGTRTSAEPTIEAQPARTTPSIAARLIGAKKPDGSCDPLTSGAFTDELYDILRNRPHEMPPDACVPGKTFTWGEIAKGRDEHTIRMAEVVAVLRHGVSRTDAERHAARYRAKLVEQLQSYLRGERPTRPSCELLNRDLNTNDVACEVYALVDPDFTFDWLQDVYPFFRPADIDAWTQKVITSARDRMSGDDWLDEWLERENEIRRTAEAVLIRAGRTKALGRLRAAAHYEPGDAVLGKYVHDFKLRETNPCWELIKTNVAFEECSNAFEARAVEWAKKQAGAG